MSVGEIIGLALIAVLIGGAAGGAVGAMLARGRNDRARQRHRAAEAYARWLAARWTMSRASLSFVAAFRALAAERRESINFSLREQEAQRARADWCETMRELDRAEAEIAVLEPASITRRRPGPGRPDADELRAAIQADSAAVEAFRQRLEAEDAQAAAFVRAAFAPPARTAPALQLACAPLEFARRVVERWSAR